MKVSAKGTSRFLSQEDIPAPFTTIIKNLTIESLKSNRGDEDKYILYLTHGKPMVCNVVNRKTIIAVYGDNSDAWIGKPIEVFVDPNVWMGGERTGGIRVRVPAQVPAGHRLVSATAQPTNAPSPASLNDRHAQILTAFAACQSLGKLSEWRTWGKGFMFDDQHLAQLDAGYDAAFKRLTPATGQAPSYGRQPAMA